MTKLPHPSKLLIVLLFGLCGVMQANAQDDASEIQRLLRAGQTEAASARVEAALASNPKNANLRFLRGVIQIDQKKDSEAIATFQRMIEEFPDLPEPYNNLAVLYANHGQHDKARAALELALRTNPSYATAHENLGDVYTKMASESYTKALQLDSGNTAAKIKLNSITSLASNNNAAPTNNNRSNSPATVAAPTTQVAIVAPVVVTPQPVAKIDKPVVVAPTPVSIVSPAVLNVSNANKAKDDTDVVYETVVAWAKAWGRKDMDAYIGSYSKDFKPTNGGSHKKWMAERRDRIEGKRNIAVSLEAPTVVIKGDVATVKFRQIYEADKLSATSRKTLKLRKTEGEWKIIEEVASTEK